MGWMQKCAQTYENNRQMILQSGGKAVLAPLNYISQKAQIEIELRPDGSFVSAREIPETDQETLIPVTEKSGGRTSGIEAHPLCEQLGYAALGHPNAPEPEQLTDGEREDYAKKYRAYVSLLESWKNSPHSHFIVDAVWKYVTGGTMLYDLANVGLLKLTPDGKITKCKIGKADYPKCLVRWIVQSNTGIMESWKNRELADCFQAFLSTTQEPKIGLCYVTGEVVPLAGGFPKGISKFDNGAKLLSANDTTNFTFRGRFTNADEAFGVGAETSQKAHAALSWLVANQGRYYSGQTFVCWNPGGKKGRYIDDFDADLYGDVPEGEDTFAYTESAYAERLQKAISGERQKLDDNDEILILGMEAATTGRMAITYYNQLSGSDYLDRLESWQRSCAWYFPIFGNHGNVVHEYIRSPSIEKIINCCFGCEKSEKGRKEKWIQADPEIHKSYSKRILLSIIDKNPVTDDLVKSIVNNASMRMSYNKYSFWNKKEEKFESWDNYRILLSVACALIRKSINDQKGREEITMELDLKKTDRSYLFGRLLAIAELIEVSTYDDEEKEHRIPNANRMQTAFTTHPFRTWKELTDCWKPYFDQLPYSKRVTFNKMIEDIIELFDEKDYHSNAPLDGMYLVGYYLQLREYYKPKNAKDNDQ